MQFHRYFKYVTYENFIFITKAPEKILTYRNILNLKINEKSIDWYSNNLLLE